MTITAWGNEEIKFISPVPHEVIQRSGFAPAMGYAMVSVQGELPESFPQDVETLSWSYRIIPLLSTNDVQSPWHDCSIEIDEQNWKGTVRVGAGGWYRLELRCLKANQPLVQGSIEPFGVGEVFVVAGQSYATNCNDERLSVQDPQQRVVAYDFSSGNWQVANDPQPVVDGSSDGSIWPPIGDALVNELKVPVAFANVAVGGTSSVQWQPQGNLHPRLAQLGNKLGKFRAVLWQQGESDVIAKTTTEEYVNNVLAIRRAAVAQWSIDPHWLLAKSTHHPTVYNDSEGEARIRRGIDLLCAKSGFVVGPDTDTLTGENRGDANSRRHFSPLGQANAAQLWLKEIRTLLSSSEPEQQPLQIGIAEIDITPPPGFPMAGYYHERLADGLLDPLKAKAIVFRDHDTAGALVVCDLIGIATDLSSTVRKRAAERIGIPAKNIVLAATHTHTAPDYMKELWLRLGNEQQDSVRAEYIDRLIEDLVTVIEQANQSAKPSLLESGIIEQKVPISFNRRFVMRDGSVQTWQNFDNPNVVRAAGPIDPQIAVLAIRDPEGKARAVLSNFALHLDTVGGQKWSADYPFYLSKALQSHLGDSVISLFGTGCCGDINHADPDGTQRNNASFIGSSIANSIVSDLDTLVALQNQDLKVLSRVVHLPLQQATKVEVDRSIQIVESVKKQEKVDFLHHVTAYKKLMLDLFRHPSPYAQTANHITWGLSRSLAGVGETIPVDVTVMTVGQEVAIVCLPGEVFVELGLAIKQASPYPTTLVIELSNTVETIYIPHSAAYAGGSYEVTNSAVEAGSGEMLVNAALDLLRQCSGGKATIELVAE